MDQQIFTDGIGRITLIDGVVRLDLVTYSPNETDAQGKPRQVFTQRVVLGTEAFLRSTEKMLEIVQQLSRHGAHIQPPVPASIKTTAPNSPTPQAPVQQTPVPPAPAPQMPEPQQKPVESKPTAPTTASEPPFTSGPLFSTQPDKPVPRVPFP